MVHEINQEKYKHRDLEYRIFLVAIPTEFNFKVWHPRFVLIQCIKSG